MRKVVVIGAGPAGLTAALELLRQSKAYEVTVLEESEAIGGISRTLQHHGNRMDIGGHRFFSKDERVMDWWRGILPMQGAPSLDDRLLGRKKPLVPGGPDPETEDKVMLVRDRVSRIYYENHFFDYPISINWNTLRGMGFGRTLKAGFSYLHAALRKLPEDSLENFYINRFGRVLYAMFFEGYTEKLWGRHPRDISADWGAQRVKGLSISAIIGSIFSKVFRRKGGKVETSLIEEFIYPKYGPGQLWETVAEQITEMGGEIRMGCRVTGLQAANGRMTGVRYVHDGIEHVMAADILLSTMPVKDLVSAMEDVPEDVLVVAKGLPYRDFVTVGVLVPALKIQNKSGIKTLGDIVPDCWIYIQDPSVKMGRLQIFNNWSPYMVADPLKTVWIGLEYFCDEGDAFWHMSDAECIQFAIRELAAIGIIQEGAVLDACRERVKKAYPAYFDTYSQFGGLQDYLDGFENLYCLGRNGQHRYNNMDHSMVTAFTAVENIISGRRDKANIWHVNTEKEYHEGR